MAGRVYKQNGKSYPSSTTICGQLDKSGPLTWWAAGCAADFVIEKVTALKTPKAEVVEVVQIAEAARKQFRSVSSKAAGIGTAVHKAVEHYLKTGQEPKIDDDQILSGFLAFLEWAEEHKLKALATEITLYGENYAGTCDLICTLAGRPFVVDFKTSKQPRNGKPYEEWGYQLASYRHAAELDGLVPNGSATGHGILRLDKESGYPDWYDISEQYEADLKVFQALAKVWWLRHPEHADGWEGAHSIAA
jgi:hypothetical protein